MIDQQLRGVSGGDGADEVGVGAGVIAGGDEGDGVIVVCPKIGREICGPGCW